MPHVPKTCPATGIPISKDYIHTLNGNFVDSNGRTLLLRGVNLSGSSKAPEGQFSYQLDNFWESAQNGGRSFIGRPLNVDDGSADEHLRRLRGWGFNMLRYPITWEALEHEGPGRYDYEFMDYTIRVLRKCKEYGFKVYMDPHQDTWSRFSGGSGAPYWTLAACGINPQAFTATQAAIVHCEYSNASRDTPDPASLPAMIWSTNYGRLACQTLFALFFGGRTFAPKCAIDGVNIQEYLQSHFIRAFGALAERIRDAGGLLDEVVIGWDSMNEPAEGFIGYEDLNVYPTTQGSALKKGTVPTPLQSLKLGMGMAQTLDNYTFGSFGSKRSGTVTVDPEGVRIWADPSTEPGGVHPMWGWKRASEWTLGTCLWALHGVWDVETGSLLQPEYFRYHPASSQSDSNQPALTEVRFLKDFFLPHLTLYVSHIRGAHPAAIAFVQAPVFAIPPQIPESLLRGRACHSTHYYDGLTLVTRHWHLFNADALGIIRGKYSSPIFAGKFGERAIRASFQSQLAILKSDAVNLGAIQDGDSSEPPASPKRYPTIIGEIGTPIDMDDKKAYDPNNKDYRNYLDQEHALDASLNATDGPNALNYTVWTYCPDNSYMWGDGWNNEDLSLWSADDMTATRKNVSSGAGRFEAFWSMDPARTSSLTLATLPVPSLPYVATKPQTLHDLLRFLRDGARAVRAFCRPYPTKTVGTPVDIQFDIGKASLVVKIRVTPEDAPQTEQEEFASGLGKAGDDESSLPTEIFLPIVHFASDDCVKRSVGAREREQVDSEDVDTSSSSDSGVNTPRVSTASTLSLPLAVSLGLDKVKTESYDFEVKVSEGRVEMCDSEQTLKWFYAVPLNGQKEVSIEIKRAGGAINWAKVTADSTGQTVKRGLKGWFQTLCRDKKWCPDGCLIM